MQRTYERIISFVFLALTIHFLYGCVSQQVTPTTSSSKLTIDEYPLQYAPAADPLSFIPEQGSQEEILAKHQQERSMPAPNNSLLFEDQPAFSVQVGNENLVAFESYTDTVTDQGTFQKVTVKVLKDTQVVWSTDAGDVSPINNLRGLWSYSDHWVLEIAHVTLDLVSNESPLEPVGEIIQDGKSLNELNKYDQTFGFQLIKGKPFFFFQQNGKIGISYDGEQVFLEYDQIPHYQCCSAAELNPRIAPSMVSFFAQRQGTWYYVEIGNFK
jgi:hypothetical protein